MRRIFWVGRVVVEHIQIHIGVVVGCVNKSLDRMVTPCQLTMRRLPFLVLIQRTLLVFQELREGPYVLSLAMLRTLVVGVSSVESASSGTTIRRNKIIEP